MLLKKILLLTLVLYWGCSSPEFDIPSQQEKFNATPSYNNKVDIVFMVDNSSSMLVYQQRLSQQVQGLIESLNLKNLDYRIAVVSSDLRPTGSGGRLIGNPPFYFNGTPNIVSLLSQRLVIGQTGSDIESGLGSLKAALSTEASKNLFLRSDAVLAMIVLTNEDDYSLGSVNEYKTYFEELKPSVSGASQGWILNFIGVVDIDGNCRTTADFKEAGLRYMALADLSGGVKASICETNLAGAVLNLEKKLVQILSEFRLNRPPLVESIKVYINNSEVPKNEINGWSYQEQRNSVLFHGSFLPGAFDTIRVDFTPSGGN